MAYPGRQNIYEATIRRMVQAALDEQEQRAINECLAYIADHIHEQPEVKIQYFVSDEHKSGGAIIEVLGKVKKISSTDTTIVMADGCKIKNKQYNKSFNFIG